MSSDKPFARWTDSAKRVLELALRESIALGHNYIGTEHLLLALVRQGEGMAANVLLSLDCDAERVRNEVIRQLSTARKRQVPAVLTEEGVRRIVREVLAEKSLEAQ